MPFTDVFALLLGEAFLFVEEDISTGEQGYGLITVPVVLFVLLVFGVAPSLLVLFGCLSVTMVFFVNEDDNATP